MCLTYVLDKGFCKRVLADWLKKCFHERIQKHKFRTYTCKQDIES